MACVVSIRQRRRRSRKMLGLSFQHYLAGICTSVLREFLNWDTALVCVWCWLWPLVSQWYLLPIIQSTCSVFKTNSTSATTDCLPCGNKMLRPLQYFLLYRVFMCSLTSSGLPLPQDFCLPFLPRPALSQFQLCLLFFSHHQPCTNALSSQTQPATQSLCLLLKRHLCLFQ